MELTAFTTPPTQAAGPKKARNVTHWAIGASLGAHGLIAGLLLLGDFGFEPPMDLNKNNIQTRLVKLGKERKKEWLPRKSQPPKPKPIPKPKAKVEKKIAAPKPTAQKPKPAATKPKKPFKIR